MVSNKSENTRKRTNYWSRVFATGKKEGLFKKKQEKLRERRCNITKKNQKVYRNNKKKSFGNVDNLVEKLPACYHKHDVIHTTKPRFKGLQEQKTE